MSQQVTDYYTNTCRELVEFLGSNMQLSGRVLEVGCAAGRAGPLLRGLGAAVLEGIEPYPKAAELACSSGIYDAVYCCTWDDWLPTSESYDAIIFADVLEHLADTDAVLRRVHALLSVPTGKLVLSLPNVRHLSVLLDLVVRGEWRYRPAGILDQTHLRFFTSKSASRLLRENDYCMEAFARYGDLRLTRRLASVWPWLGEFLLSQLFIIAAPIASKRPG